MSKPDPNPLLSHAPSDTIPPLEEEEEENKWTHIFQATLISLACFFDAQQTFIGVFTDAEPKWTCHLNTTSSCTNNSPCQLSDDAWSWTLPPTTSIISEWSLQCAGPVITGLPSSSFFFGCLLGGFALATLADSSLGRKNVLALSCLMMSLAGVVTAFSTNVWVYSAFRFLSGFGRATVGTCALVLTTELVGKRWRGKLGSIGFTSFALGFLSLPAIAYALRGYSWRLLYISTCVPCVLYSLSVFFLVPESPRWRLIKGLSQISFDDMELEHEVTHIFSTVTMLLKKRWSCRRILAVLVVGFGIGVVYYGMPLGLGNLSFDLYLSATLNALSELPASFLVFLAIGSLDRKGCLLGLSLLSGVSSVGCALLTRNKGAQVAVELVAFFSACTAFDLIMIYAVELFPTSVRNSVVTLVRQAVVLGGAVSPVVMAGAGRKNGLAVSYGVFGVTISMCGACVAFLPETKGRVLCDTMEEEERNASGSSST